MVNKALVDYDECIEHLADIEVDKAAEIVRMVLCYDSNSGDLKWKKRASFMFKTQRDCDAWNTRFAGKQVISEDKDGYIRVRIYNRVYKAHRLAWLHFYGQWPVFQIDHENKNKKDNSIKNLRDVDNSTNQKNRKLQRNNVSGCCGVFWSQRDSRWIARIKNKGKTFQVGSFVDFSEAVVARNKANEEYGFHKNHGVRSFA